MWAHIIKQHVNVSRTGQRSTDMIRKANHDHQTFHLTGRRGTLWSGINTLSGAHTIDLFGGLGTYRLRRQGVLVQSTSIWIIPTNDHTVSI